MKYVTEKEVYTYVNKEGVLKLTKEEYELLKSIILRYLKEAKDYNDDIIERWREHYGDLKIDCVQLYINYPSSPCVFKVEVEE